MHWLAEQWLGARDFVELGGWVVLVIAACMLVMWVLIVERWLYLRFGFRRTASALIAEWHDRADRTSWYAHQIRRGMISRANGQAVRSLAVVKTLVAVCPLLGLFGTVTGMIKVFDVMALLGNDNPRAMAAGVSEATYTTLAGLVAAVSALPLAAQLDRRARAEVEWLEDELSAEA
jgi:biopolymer transport protein ExbB